MVTDQNLNTALPDVLCISCGSVCSVDVESRTASCTGTTDDDEPCPQRYGFRNEGCANGWFGPYATLFGEIGKVETLRQKVEYETGLDTLWAALRTHLGCMTVAEYHADVAMRESDWERVAEKYMAEKGWNRTRWWARLRRVFSQEGTADHA